MIVLLILLRLVELSKVPILRGEIERLNWLLSYVGYAATANLFDEGNIVEGVRSCTFTLGGAILTYAGIPSPLIWDLERYSETFLISILGNWRP